MGDEAGSLRPALVAGATRGAGRAIAVELAREDITDTDGSRPDCWGYLAAYGWERADAVGIEDFR